MADVAQSSSSQSKPAPSPNLAVPPTPSLAIPSSATPQQRARQQLHLEPFSPVTQYGSYEFDRIIKSGEVHKRTRKTKVCMEWTWERECFTKGACSRGSPYGWCCGQTCFQSTRTRQNRNYGTRSTFPSSQQSRDRKIPSAKTSMYLDCFRRRATTTSRLHQIRKRRNGWNVYEEKREWTNKRRKCSWPARVEQTLPGKASNEA